MHNLDNHDWRAIIPALRTFAISRLRISQTEVKRDAADDIIMDAIERFMTGQRKWTPEKEPSLVNFLRGVINSIISDSYRTKKPSEEPFEDGFEDQIVSVAAKEDEQVSGVYLFGFMVSLDSWNRFVTDCAHQNEDVELLVAMLEANKARTEISTELGWEMGRVYELTRRLKKCLQAKITATS